MRRPRWSNAVIAAAIAASSATTMCARAEAATRGNWYTASATFLRPPRIGHVVEPLSAVSVDLKAHGYVEQEFFASGTARALKATSMPADGRWKIEPTTSASYRTRIIVRRPVSQAKFNGTVVVEWMNVTAGETAPDWDYLNPMLVRDGYAYVGVSAQALGVQGGEALLGGGRANGGLVGDEPDRYGSLHHPGDRYALDIFAQIGQGLRSKQRTNVLGPLSPRHILAVGESQSAFYLTGFADALQPHTKAYDGIFIHSRGGGAAGIGGSLGLDGAVRIRTDLSVPVFMFETQTDVTTLGYAAARQPDTSRIRTWEVAGTSHADAYLVNGDAKILGCTQAINDGPQHPVVQAAFTAFENWVVHRTPPPSPPDLRLVDTHPPRYALDKYGNVLGGVRTPAVDVPTSTLSGQGPPDSGPLCALFGSATPLSAAVLASLYPTKAQYVAQYTKSLDRAIKNGFILAADRSALLAQARGADIPG